MQDRFISKVETNANRSFEMKNENIFKYKSYWCGIFGFLFRKPKTGLFHYDIEDSFVCAFVCRCYRLPSDYILIANQNVWTSFSQNEYDTCVRGITPFMCFVSVMLVI